MIGAVVVAGVAYVGYRQQKSQGEEGVVKIGGLFGLTGYAAFAGEASRDGFLMAIEDAGLNPQDYPIEDFHSEQKDAVGAASKLINTDKVTVVIGPEWLEFGEVVVPLANSNKVLFISPWMVGEPAWVPSPYYLSGMPSERVLLKRELEYMAAHGVKKLALVYHNNAWSHSNIKILKEEIVSQNQIDIVNETEVNMTDTDFRTQLVKIHQQKPDAIYVAFADDNNQGIFNKQMMELGMRYQVYVPQSTGANTVLKDRFEQYLNGVIWPDKKQGPREQEFESKFEKRYGKKPGAISAATAYDMTTLVLQAIKNGAHDSDSIARYLRDVKDYQGYSNTITFNEKGQVASEEVVLKQIAQPEDKVLQ